MPFGNLGKPLLGKGAVSFLFRADRKSLTTVIVKISISKVKTAVLKILLICGENSSHKASVMIIEQQNEICNDSNLYIQFLTLYNVLLEHHCCSILVSFQLNAILFCHLTFSIILCCHKICFHLTVFCCPILFPSKFFHTKPFYLKTSI